MFIIFSEFAPLIINTELCVTSGDQFSVSLCCVVAVGFLSFLPASSLLCSFCMFQCVFMSLC